MELKITPYLFLSEDQAAKKQGAQPPQEELLLLANFFKMFGDPTRLSILFYLSQGDVCVGDLAALMDMTPSAVSHQLNLLKSTELVRYQRKGKTITYSLADSHVRDVIKIGWEHIKE